MKKIAGFILILLSTFLLQVSINTSNKDVKIQLGQKAKADYPPGGVTCYPCILIRCYVGSIGGTPFWVQDYINDYSQWE